MQVTMVTDHTHLRLCAHQLLVRTNGGMTTLQERQFYGVVVNMTTYLSGNLSFAHLQIIPHNKHHLVFASYPVTRLKTFSLKYVNKTYS